MARRVAIAVFVDACGHGILGPRPWFLPSFEHRQRVTSLFGYSSACVPAILTGLLPNENDHWSAFYYAPASSPFRALRGLKALPAGLMNRGRVRALLSKAVARAYGFTGYFQIYNVPFDVLPLYDYAEKRDIFKPGGINRGASIFDKLSQQQIPYHASDWRRSEQENIASLRSSLATADTRFAFLYTASLDALMHDHTKESPKVDDKLRWYQEQIEDLRRCAEQHYDEVRIALFSDHGMATVEQVVDLMPAIEGTGLRFGEDYAAVYDSTMMRFWFLEPRSEALIRDALPDAAHGRWVSDEMLRSYGTYWPDGRFGDAVYALEPGTLLNPSHMGNTALAGMHGYRPDHPDSDSALIANFQPDRPVERITDLHGLMADMAAWANG